MESRYGHLPSLEVLCSRQPAAYCKGWSQVTHLRNKGVSLEVGYRFVYEQYFCCIAYYMALGPSRVVVPSAGVQITRPTRANYPRQISFCLCGQFQGEQIFCYSGKFRRSCLCSRELSQQPPGCRFIIAVAVFLVPSSRVLAICLILCSGNVLASSADCRLSDTAVSLLSDTSDHLPSKLQSTACLLL